MSCPSVQFQCGKKMQHRLVRTPLGLIHIVDVLREASQVDNAKVRATCRPTVRSRLTDIIEARPDVLSTDKVVVLYMAHSTFVTVAPRNMTVVVGGARERGIIERLVPTFGPDEHRITRHPVVTACHQAGNTFRYDERLTGEVLGNTCKPVVMVIEADNIKRTGTEQMIVRIRLVAACRHGRVASSFLTISASFFVSSELTDISPSFASISALWPKFKTRLASARLKVSALASVHCSSTSLPILHMKMEG